MRDKLHARIALLVILVVCGLLYERYPARSHLFHIQPPTDFGVYLRAWDRVSQGINPYVLSDPSPYKYSPGVLALMSFLPAEPAQAWWVFSTFCILGLGVALFVGARYNSWKSIGLLILGVVLAWKGILETLDYGQLEILLLAIAVGAGALRMRAPVVAGLLAGSLPWFKLPWVLLLLPLILTPIASLSGPGRKPRRVRLLISGYFFSWFLWGAAIPAVTFGKERAALLLQSWVEVITQQPGSLYLSDVNQSFWISAHRWLGGNAHLSIALVCVSGGLLLGSLTARLLKVSPNREVFGWLSPWLILTQLLNPLSWRWGSVFVIGVPFAISGMTATVGRTVARNILLVIGIVLFLVQLNPVVKAFGYGHWSDFHGYGVLTAYWLVLLMLCLQPSEYWAD